MKKLNWKAALGVVVAVAGVLSGPAGLALFGAKVAAGVSLVGTTVAAVTEALFSSK